MGSQQYNQVQFTKLRKNIFDLTHDKKLSTVFGKLTPMFLMDVVPGDKVNVKTSVLLRFAPLVAPVMHRINVYCHFFFVPNRILWSNWEKFITGGEDGYDTSVPPTISLDLAGIGQGSLVDYLGLPIGTDVGPAINEVQVSAFPFAVYQKIYQDYYRDQNLIPEDDRGWKLIDGVNVLDQKTGFRLRALQHDKFTSALPWTQKGPEALLPLGAAAPIRAYDWADQPNQPALNFLRDSETGNYPLTSGDTLGQGVAGTDPASLGSVTTPDTNYYLDLNDTNFADLSQATAASIVDVRRAFKLQEYLEKNARGGTRYKEFIMVHFGINTSDGRLQRAEYLGGYSQPVKVSEVLQTSGSPGTGEYTPTPQGNMSGHGISVGGGSNISWFAEEHGYIMGIMSVMPMTAYQQGIPKMFLRRDKFDYFTPEFQHIGEQPIENQELFVNGTLANTGTFGYEPRYIEYKDIPNTVHGNFRTTLDTWHLGRKFQDSPVLNREFIECDPADYTRIFAVDGYEPGEDYLWCHVLNETKAARPMAFFGNPKF